MSERGREEPDSSSPKHPAALVLAAAVFYFLTLVFQGKIATLELGSFFTIFCLVWAIVRREIRFSAHILYFPLALYGIASTLSNITAQRRIHEWGEGVLWFKMLIFPTALILLRELPWFRGFVIRAQATFVSYVSVWGLAEYFLFGRRDLEHRINGPSTHVMTFSGMLLPLSLMFMILWWHQRKAWQLAVGSIATFTLLLTFTRSVWLGWLVAMLVVLVASRIRLLFYAVPAILLFVTLLPLPLFSRVISTFDLQQSSNLDRIRMIEAGTEMIRDFPLLGVGPGNVKDVYALYRRHDAPRPRPPHLHNNLVQIWAERGVLGLGGYLLLLGLFLRECVRGWRTERRMWSEVGIAIAVSLTVAGLFEFNFGDTEVFYVMLNLFALVLASVEAPRASNEPADAGVQLAQRGGGDPGLGTEPGALETVP